MNSRNVVKTIGAGVLGSASGNWSQLLASRTEMTDSIQRPDRKIWARKSFRGMEAFVFPSITPAQTDLDEEGIRHDVRHSISQGFGAIYAIPLGLSRSESRRFIELVCNEADGKIIIGGTSTITSQQDAASAFTHAEASGVSEMLMSLDPRISTEEEIFERGRALSSATRLGLVLYLSPNPAFRKFHPNGLPMKAIDRLLDLPNVIAVKLTQQINLVTAFEVAELLRGRALLGIVNLETALLIASKYSLQWSGEWAVDAVQSPQKPFAVRFMDLLSKGQLNEAANVYWQMQPALEAFFDLQGPILAAGGHPWAHIRYYKWLTGGNGGLFRDLGIPPQQMPILDAHARQACRDALQSVGIALVDLPDEAFVVGNAAYARGARLSDMPSTPCYTA